MFNIILTTKYKLLTTHRGFTLVELLITVGIISIIAVVGGDILLTVVRAYKKAQTLGEVEQNGTYASTVLENYLRSSSDVEECSSGCVKINEGDTVSTNSINLISAKNGAETEVFFEAGSGNGPGCTNGYISAGGSNITSTDISKGVNIAPASGSVFQIFNPIGSPAVVTVNFKVNSACASLVTAEAQFNTTVTLRGDYGK